MQPIVQKAIRADFIRSSFIPAFSNKPITLSGIPYFISGLEIFSEAFGWILPRKKPIIRKGKILMNNFEIVLIDIYEYVI